RLSGERRVGPGRHAIDRHQHLESACPGGVDLRGERVKAIVVRYRLELAPLRLNAHPAAAALLRLIEEIGVRVEIVPIAPPENIEAAADVVIGVERLRPDRWRRR